MSSKSLPENDPTVNTPSQTNQARSKFRLIPMSDDRLFAPDCDLLSIKQNTETKLYSIDSSTQDTQYITGEHNLSTRKFPTIALQNIQRIQARLSGKVGIHPLVSGSISWGLYQINRNKWIRQLRNLDMRHKLLPEDFPGMVNKTIHEYLNRFEVSIPDGTPLAIKVHDRVDGRLTELAFKIGVSKTALISLSTCLTISDQINCIKDDKVIMEKFLDEFYESARIRATAVKGLMDVFNAPELPDQELEN